MTYILAADDEFTNQIILEEMLSDCCEIVCVYNGAQCLESIAQRRPDLLLLDVSMPIMDGYEVCRSLRADAKTHDLPIIILSGHAHREQIEEGFAAGADKYLTKPFTQEELLAAMHELIAFS